MSAATAEGLCVKRVSISTESVDEWLYDVEWQPRARLDQWIRRPAPDYLAEPSAIAARLEEQLEALYARLNLKSYEELAPKLEILSTAYINRALHDVGKDFEPVAQHARLFQHLRKIIQAEPAVPAEPATMYELLLRDYPAGRGELTLIARCGESLAEVLRGRVDPRQLLFPDGSLELTEQLYQDSPGARAFNGLIQSAIMEALRSLPEGRSLRVLEIGAGTGGTTASILPVLPRKQTEYVFTDVSHLFTARAAEKFHEYGFIRYQLLDVENDPIQQGFAPNQFDIVVAANVLHATASLQRTVEYVRRLMAPGGLLLLLEGTTPQRWQDLIFGMTEGWWKFSDSDLRMSHPLLAPDQWLQLLNTTGFTSSRCLSPEVRNPSFLPTK
jgi:SAM-dependent methyltransferase